MKNISTIGQLKKALKNIPDDEQIIVLDKAGNEHNIITIGDPTKTNKEFKISDIWLII